MWRISRFELGYKSTKYQDKICENVRPIFKMGRRVIDDYGDAVVEAFCAAGWKHSNFRGTVAQLNSATIG